MYVEFYRLAVGAVFEWRGHRYRKEAMCMACDKGRPDGYQVESVEFSSTDLLFDPFPVVKAGR